MQLQTSDISGKTPQIITRIRSQMADQILLPLLYSIDIKAAVDTIGLETLGFAQHDVASHNN